jgi:hypothetical protein
MNLTLISIRMVFGGTCTCERTIPVRVWYGSCRPLISGLAVFRIPSLAMSSSCLPNSAALIMAPPIKQEKPPPLEDCRLLLKNAVDIKLKGHFIISRRDGSR